MGIHKNNTGVKGKGSYSKKNLLYVRYLLIICFILLSGNFMQKTSLLGTDFKYNSLQNPIFSSALSFDGTNDYVQINSNLGITDNWTISLWIKVKSTERSVFFSIPDTHEVPGVEFSVNDEQKFQIRNYHTTINGIMLPSISQVQISQWYFAVGTYNTTHVTLYINGSKEGSVAMTGATRTSYGKTFIGAFSASFSTGVNALEGIIDEVQVLNRSLTGPEIIEDFQSQRFYPPRAGTVAWYHFNEGMGDIVRDSSFNQYSGTVYGATFTQKFTIPLDCSRALSFDGTNDYVQVDSNLGITDNWTISLWIKVKSIERSAFFSIPDTHEVPGVEFSVNGEQKFQIRNYHTTINRIMLPSLTQVQTSKWYFVVGTYNTTHVTLYINGSKEGSVAMTGATRTSYGKTFIGAFSASFSTGVNALEGIIDEVRVLNRSLTELEIIEDFQTQGFYPQRFETVAWYHFDEGMGNIVQDSSLNQYSGTIYGALWIFISKTPTPELTPGWTILPILISLLIPSILKIGKMKRSKTRD
ncbi:MAG: LamG domain-containing protein [Candidatus Hodarchaeales archaeon]